MGKSGLSLWVKVTVTRQSGLNQVVLGWKALRMQEKSPRVKTARQGICPLLKPTCR